MRFRWLEIHLAVALSGMRVPRPHQRAAHEHRHIQGGAFDKLAIVQISGKGAGRDGVVAAGLRARDAKSTGEWSQRDLDPRAELGHLTLPIEVEIFHLAVGEFLRKLPE